MKLTRFVRCSSCGREVRVFDHRVGRELRPGTQLPEDGATSASDGSFECPFCATGQEQPE